MIYLDFKKISNRLLNIITDTLNSVVLILYGKLHYAAAFNGI